MAQAVQFKGKDAVIQAYINRKIPSFAIFLGKQFLFPFPEDDINSGIQELTDILDSLSNGTNAVYTVKVYEDIKEGDKITDKTPCDGSFNFQLNQGTMMLYEGAQARINGTNEMNSRMAAIEKMLKDREAEPTLYDKILEVCDTEVGKAVAPQLISGVLQMLGIGRMPQISGTIGNVPGTQPGSNEVLAGSIAILKECDPNFTTHMAKLAGLAKTNPPAFNALLLMLDKM